MGASLESSFSAPYDVLKGELMDEQRVFSQPRNIERERPMT